MCLILTAFTTSKSLPSVSDNVVKLINKVAIAINQTFGALLSLGYIFICMELDLVHLEFVFSDAAFIIITATNKSLEKAC